MYLRLELSTDMARLLQRLGAFSVRRRRLVLGSWLLGLVVLAGLAVAFKGTFSDQFKVPGTESQRAIELIEQAVPQANADGATGRVVFASDAKLDEAAMGAAVKQLREPCRASPPRPPPVVAPDGRIAYTDLQFTLAQADVSATQTDAIEQAAKNAAPQVEFGGSAAAVCTAKPPIGEVLGVVVAMLVLAITFGSLLAAGLPLLTAMFGVGIGMLGITLASGFTDLDARPSTDAGRDARPGGRHRLRAVHPLPPPHAGRATAWTSRSRSRCAVGTAGSAVVFAGSTVIIALVALAVTGVPFLAADGHRRRRHGRRRRARQPHARPRAARLRRRPASRRGKTFGRHDDRQAHARRPLGRRSSCAARCRRRALVIVALGALAIPALDLRLGLPNDGTADPDTTQRQAYDLVSEGFGAGVNGQLTSSSTPRRRRRGRHARQHRLADAAGRRRRLARAGHRRAGDLALISVTPSSGPSSERHREPGQRRSAATSASAQRPALLRDRPDRDRTSTSSQRMADALDPVPRGRRRARAAAADDRVPLDPRPADRDRRLPADDRRLASGAVVPSSRTASRRPVRRRADRRRSSACCRS